MEHIIKPEVLNLDKIVLRKMEYRKLEVILRFGIFALQDEVEAVLADGNWLAPFLDVLAEIDSISKKTALGKCVVFVLGEIHRYYRLGHFKFWIILVEGRPAHILVQRC